MIYKIPKKTDLRKSIKRLSYFKKRNIKLFDVKRTVTHSLNLRKIAPYNNKCIYYKICLYVCQHGKLTIDELEAMRKVLTRYLKKSKVKTLILKTDFIVKSKKPSEVRMGKGKGNVKEWFLPVKKYSVLLELYFRSSTKSYKLVNIACSLSLKKLSLKSNFCIKEYL
jgi:ribosomal protein L16/L10AE